MGFLDAFSNLIGAKETENGAFAYDSTNSAIVDLFGAIGGMRNRSEKDIVTKYLLARNEDKELADKIILYARDIRGGLGERRIGRILLKTLATIDPIKVKRNLPLFVDYGRFDDLYALEGTPVEPDMWKYMKRVFFEDFKNMREGKPITLAAKWIKSINTSSKESRRLAKKFCNYCNLSEKKYRKMLSELRFWLDVVEKKMSANDWEYINFENVPSLAMKKYKNCFYEHSRDRMNEYINNVSNGTAKINASTLYPYDILYDFMCKDNSDDAAKVLNAQWNAMPDYFTGSEDVICCADVSGSMLGRPMAASVGLAMYCAKHNKGAYKGYYLTFTDTPRFFKFDDNMPLEYNIDKVIQNIGFNTNLDGMLLAIFNMALETNDSPKALLIVSDCEIDDFVRKNPTDTIVAKWKEMFESKGLKMPKIIFWNVSALHDTYLEHTNTDDVCFISGCSATTFKNLDDIINCSQYELMHKILDKYEYK